MEIREERAGANLSFWERTAQKFSTAPLQRDITTDVCVIGAGIAGVTTAYLVRWDGCEKPWDCPCHGSRFDALGCVLNGPAIFDLERVEVPA